MTATTTILFDPLYPNGFGVYQMVPEAMRQDLMSGAALLTTASTQSSSATCIPDHFSVDEIITYLQTA